MNKIRLRLAPSPTGFLHIGNLRTALFGYLLAKSSKGVSAGGPAGDFILRIEDTDEKREVEGAIDSLIDILKWFGIKFDEGPHIGGEFGPYVQTERLAIYQEHYERLLASGGAYRCFCSEERLAKMREDQQACKQAPRYDRLCRYLSPEEIEEKISSGQKFVIRQAIPTDGAVEVFDELRGAIRFQAEDLDDHVLIKANGIPTYQFASVVDDHLMEISHVTRGEEWLPSFPKNVLLYRSFGWETPKFIHLPLILNKNGGKLSKRQGDVFVEDFRAKGYLPEALINFCALLGWHDKSDKEIYTMDELLKDFSLAGMGASPAIFDIEKLDYLNGYYIRQKPISEITALLKPYLAEQLALAPSDKQTDRFLHALVATASERLKKLSDISELTKFYFENNLNFSREMLSWKEIGVEQAVKNLEELENLLEQISEVNWQKDYLEEFVFGWLKDNDKKVGEYLWPLRVALTGERYSPGPFEVMGVLGKDESMQRLRQARRI